MKELLFLVKSMLISTFLIIIVVVENCNYNV